MIALANGAGWDRASAAVKAVANASAVYNIGFCGALDHSLGIGDIFVATQVRGAGREAAALLPAGPVMKSGILISVPRIAQTAGEKRQLRKTGAFVVEMEAAGVARASEELGMPFYCVRAVSDLANEDFANNFNEYFMFDGRIHILRLIAGALKSPVKRFGELIRLSGRASLASKKLGEFLANCNY
jgi:nucleoside phosphorylase